MAWINGAWDTVIKFLAKAHTWTGVQTFSSLVATTADINAGTVDATIGGTTPAAGSFTTVTTNTSTVTAAGVGAVAGTGNAVVERGNDVIHRSIITMTNTALALADAAGVVAYTGMKIYDFPEGAILILGAVTDIDLTKSSAGVIDTWDGDVSMGIVTAANDATLTGTEANIVPSTATPQAVSGATTANAQSTATENAVHDGTATAIDLYLNFLVDDTDHDVTTTPCNLICNGTVTVNWVKLGDY